MNQNFVDLFEDIYILHLSDLHIESKDGTYAPSLKSLIDDIAKQLIAYEKAILVISGDIVNQGNYSENNQKAIVSFFSDLRDKINGKIVDVEIVPGNHDKERNTLNNLFSKAIQFDEEEINDEEWQFQLKSFQGFLKIYKEILSIFNLIDEEKSNDTFGVSSITLNTRKILFVRLDTAWSSYSNNDNGKLQIGKLQREKLLAAYKKEKENLAKNITNPNFLTIAISHHPLNLLSQSEEDECNKLFLSTDGLNVDILLCGHVHTLSLAHYFNHEHSLLTLVTGIGEAADKGDNHRYSIYALNLANNSCDIIMRRSGKTQFDYDYSIYIGDKESESRKLTYPIRVRESHPFIEMATKDILSMKRRFLDKDLLSKVPSVCLALSDFARNMANKNTFYKNDFLEKFLLESMKTKEDEAYKELEAYFTKGDELSKSGKTTIRDYYSSESFLAFLQETCDELNFCLEGCFSKEAILRTHIRVYNSVNDEYVSLCYNTNSDDELAKHSNPRTLKWNDFLETAYNRKKAIIYSANLHLNKTDTSWNDFLTIIPDCTGINGNFTEKKRKKFENIKRPWLTFGLSYKSANKSDSDILYLLSFLKVENILKSILDDYIDIFEIKLQDIVEKVTNKREAA